MKHKQHGFSLFLVLLVLVGLAVVAFAGWRVYDSQKKEQSGSNSQVDPAIAARCGTVQPGLFTNDIVHPAGIKLIQNPIRIVGTDNIKTHSFIQVNRRTPVYAPMDSKLTAGSNYIETADNPKINDVQYIMSFNDDCQVSYWVDHLIDVPDHIKRAFPSQPSSDTRNVEIQPVEVKAGEIIGYTNQPVGGIFDFGVIDRNGPVTALATIPEFQNQVKDSLKYLHAVCAFQFYNAAKQQAYAALFDPNMGPDQHVIDNLCKNVPIN